MPEETGDVKRLCSDGVESRGLAVAGRSLKRAPESTWRYRVETRTLDRRNGLPIREVENE